MPKQVTWTLQKAWAFFKQPMLEILFTVRQIHRQYFKPQQVQISTSLSIKNRHLA